MKQKLRVAGIVVAVIVVAILALPFGLNANSFRPKLEAELSSALGRTVKMGDLSISIVTGSVTAQDLSITDDAAFSGNPFVRAKSLKVGVELIPLIFSKSLHVTELTLDHPEITLLRSATGTWNFSSLGATNAAPAPTPVAAPAATPSAPATTPAASGPPATADLAVKKLDVKDGRITVGDRKS